MSELVTISWTEDQSYRAIWRDRVLADTLIPILETMDDHLTVAEVLRDRLNLIPVYIDISRRQLDNEAYMAFVRAANRVEDRFVLKGDPLTAEKFLELDVLLHRDERCAYQKYSDVEISRIELGRNGVWSAPAWIYKLAILQLCYHPWRLVHYEETDNETWWHLLWEAKDQTLCNLQDEDLKHDEILREAMELLGRTYARGRGIAGAGTLFDEKLYPAAAELYTLYKSVF